MSKKKQKKAGGYVVATILSALWLGINYYIYYPAFNVQSTEFWDWLLVHSVVVSVIFIIFGIIGRSDIHRLKDSFRDNFKYFRHGMGRIQLVLLVGIPVFCMLVLFFGGLAGSTFFNAKRYANLMPVEQREFTEDIPESENVDNIALMDTNSARVFGNRKIGSLSDVVSQFEVENDYTQINISNKPMKVANLKYASFFKYLNNKADGIPGYVAVNPVNSDAEYVKLSEGMKYVSSGYFNHNIYRHVQMHNPTKIIEGCYFEVDDEGKPYYICPVLHARVGLFSGMDVKGAILCDPVTGDMEYYDVEDVPRWVDRVYDGDLLERKFNWYGELSGGFFNSVIGQKGCIRATDDYGYKTIDDDVWIYTGVTSVTGDASNVGFIMVNQRTSEARYYTISGAEEYSAMSSAQGAVQEKNYTASFPSLINVMGQPTYIMVLTDNGGLVKMYAMVNVEQYNLVVTAENQEELFSKYKKLLANNGGGKSDGKSEESAMKEAEIIVSEMEYITMDGETYVYMKDEAANVYKMLFAEDESVIKISVGDKVSVQYDENENGIHDLISVELIEKGAGTQKDKDTEGVLPEEKKSEGTEKKDNGSEENIDEAGKKEEPEFDENKQDQQGDTSVKSEEEQNAESEQQEKKTDEQEKNSPNVDNSL
ncbi:MAG: hypothetical protein PUC12_02340 [Clostridiales bacterium]|nr:hypothetical protein [Clostridiales bacterium]